MPEHRRTPRAGAVQNTARAAHLPRHERDILAYWEGIDLYRRARERTAGKPPFVLRDAPALSTDGVGFDAMLNKLLKDFIVKFRSMQGYDAPFVPAWETHALANEIAALRTFAVPRHAVPPDELRRRCAAIARRHTTRQWRQFQRLGVRADWRFPVLTLYPAHAAAVLDTFARLVAGGHVYRAPHIVHWCPTCRATLAETETAPRETAVADARVVFPLLRAPARLFPGLTLTRLAVVVRTTSPWQLPGAVAVTAHPETGLALVTDCDDPEGFRYLVAESDAPEFIRAAKMTTPEVTGHMPAGALDGIVLLHPLSRRSIPLLTDAGAIAGPRVITPEHDAWARAFALRRGLETPRLLNADGVFSTAAGAAAAQHTPAQAVHHILRSLDHDGLLLSYAAGREARPHCWRCGQPVIRRTLAQWFLATAPLLERALAAGAAMRWQPAGSGARFAALLRARPDWCLSRQRAWGVPIPAFYCAACATPLLSPEIVAHVADIVRAEGADAWFRRPATALLPAGALCPACGGHDLLPGNDTFDIWFSAACGAGTADLVVERHDHLRGWLQGALLANLGAGEDAPPFRAVLTHGFVDARLARVPRRDGELAPEPLDLAAAHGADVLRLWVASVETHADITLTDAALRGAARLHRRLRRVARDLWTALAGAPPADASAPADQALLTELDRLISGVTTAYDTCAFPQAMRAISAFCLRDLASALPAASPAARYRCAVVLAQLLAPTLSFLAEELWQHLPVAERPASPQLTDWPSVASEQKNR